MITEILITSTVLVVILIILRSILKGKMSPIIQYALWGLVVLRLLLFVSLFPSPVSVLNAIPSLPSYMADTSVNSIKVNTDDIDIQPIVDPDNSFSKIVYDTANLVGHYTVPISVIIWLCGAAGVIVWIGITNILFYCKLRKKRTIFTTDLIKTRVWFVSDLPSPCTFGVIRPSIYVNEQSISDNKKLNHVLLHEQAHIWHGDCIWSIVRCLCLILYWYNPFVWLAAYLSKIDCELACDASVVKEIGKDARFEYGETLLHMISNHVRPSDIVCGATTMVSHKRGIKKRIQLIIQNPRTKIAAVITVIVCLFVIISVTFSAKTNKVWMNTAYAFPFTGEYRDVKPEISEYTLSIDTTSEDGWYLSDELCSDGYQFYYCIRNIVNPSRLRIVRQQQDSRDFFVLYQSDNPNLEIQDMGVDMGILFWVEKVMNKSYLKIYDGSSSIKTIAEYEGQVINPQIGLFDYLLWTVYDESSDVYKMYYYNWQNCQLYQYGEEFKTKIAASIDGHDVVLAHDRNGISVMSLEDGKVSIYHEYIILMDGQIDSIGYSGGYIYFTCITPNDMVTGYGLDTSNHKLFVLTSHNGKNDEECVERNLFYTKNQSNYENMRGFSIYDNSGEILVNGNWVDIYVNSYTLYFGKGDKIYSVPH